MCCISSHVDLGQLAKGLEVEIDQLIFQPNF